MTERDSTRERLANLRLRARQKNEYDDPAWYEVEWLLDLLDSERAAAPSPVTEGRSEICASCGWTRDAVKNHIVRGASSPAEACDECRVWLFRAEGGPTRAERIEAAAREVYAAFDRPHFSVRSDMPWPSLERLRVALAAGDTASPKGETT